MTTTLSRLQAENFRAFREPIDLPFGATATVITGGNGTGKTSVIDAITWLLTGDLRRFDELKTRRNEEYVVSAYAPANSVAKVALECHRGDRHLRLERVGNSYENALTVLENGHVVSQPNPLLADLLGLPESVAVRDYVDNLAVLRQDELRLILSSKPDALHQRLRELLGLSELDSFERAIREVVDERKTALREAQAALFSHRQESERLTRNRDLAASRVAMARQVTAARDLWLAEVARVGPYVRLPEREAPERDAAAILESLLAAHREMADTTADLILASNRVASIEVDDASLADEESKLASYRVDEAELARELQGLEMRIGQLTAALGEHELLAAAALPLLAEHCPVCEQAIDPEAVRLRLTKPNPLADQLSAADQTRRDLSARAQVLNARIAEVTESLRGRRAALAERDQVRVSIATMRSRLRQSMHGVSFPAVLSSNDDNLDAVVRETLEALVSLGRSTRSLVAASQVATSASELALAEQALGSHASKIDHATQAVSAASRLEAEASAFLKTLREAAVEVTEQSLRTLNPVFGEVYRRLAPHPTFSDLGLGHDVYYGKGRSYATLRDPIAEVSVNPNLICSVGQLNVVALSYFLAMAMVPRSSQLPFVALDDPLQSLDDVNVLGFADFCRELRGLRQVIVTTHDVRFADLLVRKLMPRTDGAQLVEWRFSGWNRSGPSVTVVNHEPQEVEFLLRRAG